MTLPNTSVFMNQIIWEAFQIEFLLKIAEETEDEASVVHSPIK